MDKADRIAEDIMEVIRQPHIDAGTPLEDIHLAESIADIVREALTDEYKDGREEGESNPRCFV